MLILAHSLYLLFFVHFFSAEKSLILLSYFVLMGLILVLGLFISYESSFLFFRLILNPFFSLKKLKANEYQAILSTATALRLKGLQQLDLKKVNSKPLKKFLELHLHLRREEEVSQFFKIYTTETIEVYQDLRRLIENVWVGLLICPLIVALMSGVPTSHYWIIFVHCFWILVFMILPLRVKAKKLYDSQLTFLRSSYKVYRALMDGESPQELERLLMGYSFNAEKSG